MLAALVAMALIAGCAGEDEVYDLTAEAILGKSRNLVVQAMLVNPVVPKVSGIREMVDVVISAQSKWLGYLQ